jgi:hypothetical protein
MRGCVSTRLANEIETTIATTHPHGTNATYPKESKETWMVPFLPTGRGML